MKNVFSAAPRHKFRRMLSALTLAGFMLLGTACDGTDGIGAEEPAHITLAFSLSPAHQPHTRMAAAVTQTDQSFRGMESMRLIPFRKRGVITTADRPTALDLESVMQTSTFLKTDAAGTSHFYYSAGCDLMPGTASVLFYGTAAPLDDHKEKAANGSLVQNFPADDSPSSIRFSTETIVSSTAIPDKAQALADYLTHIAQTPGWSTSRNSALRNYFLNFTAQTNEGVTLFAGSSANVLAHAQALYDEISGQSFTAGSEEATIAAEICSRITPLSEEQEGYPADLGLPDGAAILRWDETSRSFAPQTENTMLDPVNNLTRFAYPAALSYYVNSQIHTSNVDERLTAYRRASTWEDVLNAYENKTGSVVSRGTKSVAITKPVQYGVACLRLSLDRVSSPLTDAGGDAVTIDDGDFPLTAIIVGGQHTVGFDFAPMLPKSDADVHFIYDADVKQNADNYFALSTTAAQSVPLNTLVMQSYDGETITIALEFTNQSTQAFRSLTGLVRPGTKFYLLGTLTPESVGATAEDFRKRVFTQDYATSATIKLASLAKSYNILPDLLSPRLEIGVMLTPEWMQAEPTTVVIE